jgi:glycosyltransferase involved in cell wall biosynthesis
MGPYHAVRLAAARRRGSIGCVEVFGHEPSRPWREILNEGEFERTTLFEQYPSGGPDRHLLIQRLEATLARLAPDVVIVPSWGECYALAALRWCLRTGTRAVLMTDSTDIDRKPNRLLETIKRRLISCFSAAFVSGKRARSYLMRLGFPPERIFTGLNVVDNDYFESASAEIRAHSKDWRRRLGLPDQYFVAVSRLIEKKNIAGLLKAYSRYQSRMGSRAWHLVVIGQGAQEGTLKALANSYGLDQFVHWPGWKQYDEIPPFYCLAGALVLPSLYETWGYVVNEAEACGLPVLVSEACGCGDDLVQQGVNGWTFDPRDTSQLAALMTACTAGKANLRAMGLASCGIIDRFRLGRFVESFWGAAHCAMTQPAPVLRVGFNFVLSRLVSWRATSPGD